MWYQLYMLFGTSEIEVSPVCQGVIMHNIYTVSPNYRSATVYMFREVIKLTSHVSLGSTTLF